jgi:hypothetical protein
MEEEDHVMLDPGDIRWKKAKEIRISQICGRVPSKMFYD